MSETREFPPIDPTFCGPPGCANGGYLAGRLAATHPGAGTCQVRLNRPTPVGKPLRLVIDDEVIRLFDGADLLAEAAAAEPPDEAPAPVDWGTARTAEARYAGVVDHPFPTCFVCGPRNPRGLRLRPGPVGPGRVATTWRVAGGGHRGTPPELLWAALDCPSGWSADIAGRPMVLGRIRARILDVPIADQDVVIVGELRARAERTALTVSAIFDRDGRLLAHADATWVRIRPR